MTLDRLEEEAAKEAAKKRLEESTDHGDSTRGQSPKNKGQGSPIDGAKKGGGSPTSKGSPNT